MQSNGGKDSGLAANLPGSTVTLRWQQGQEEVAGAPDWCYLSAVCAAGCL